MHDMHTLDRCRAIENQHVGQPWIGDFLLKLICSLLPRVMVCGVAGTYAM
jgi:hypothetical protein